MCLGLYFFIAAKTASDTQPIVFKGQGNSGNPDSNEEIQPETQLARWKSVS